MPQLKDRVKTWRKPAKSFKRERAPRGSNEMALRAANRRLLLEVEESEAQKAMELARLQARIDAEDAADESVVQRDPLPVEREHLQLPVQVLEESTSLPAPEPALDAAPEPVPAPEPEPAIPKPLGYTQEGPVKVNPAYANKSDLDRTAQLIHDLQLEPATPHGPRVIRASPPLRRRSRP